jgi:probable DNA repair protein
MPHSSDARELSFARETTARLRHSAAHLTFSYPARVEDRALHPSPLLADIPSAEVCETYQQWAMKVRHSAPEPDTVEDATAPPPSEQVKGGTYLLRDYAACPFRAFARYRLNAEALEEPEPGMAPIERGSLAHDALRNLWQALGEHGALATADLATVVRDSVSAAIDGRVAKGSLAFTPRFRALEQERLEAILMDWLELERQRKPFRVHDLESKCTVHFGGLEFNVKADRIDELPDGRRVIIDYKTGEISANAWNDERLDEPQLPLYACAQDGQVAAVTFAQVKCGKLRFSGAAAEEGLLPRVKADGDWQATLEMWRAVLNQLAAGYARGDARVDPKKIGTCDHCDLHPVCRVKELAVASSDL